MAVPSRTVNQGRTVVGMGLSTALCVEELHITDAADANAVHEEDVPVVVGTARFPGRLTRSRPRNGWTGAARGAAKPIRMD